MNPTVSSNSGRRKRKCPSVLQIFLLLFQKLPPSVTLPQSPHLIDSTLSTIARHLPGNLFINVLPSLDSYLLPTSAVLGITA